MPDYDMSHRPEGPEERRDFVNFLLGKSELRETDYLEVKSEFNLQSKNDQAKVAKFVLGAANRNPGDARQHLDGFAVFVAGVGRDDIVGIAGEETIDLGDRVGKIIGPKGSGPKWYPEFVEFDDKTVMLVFVHPPTEELYPALASTGAGEGMIKSGRIYVRKHGKTDEMEGHELRVRLNILKHQPEKAEIELLDFGPVTVGTVPMERVRIVLGKEAERLRRKAPARSVTKPVENKDSPINAMRGFDFEAIDFVSARRDHFGRTVDEFHERIDEALSLPNQQLIGLRSAITILEAAPSALRLELKSATHMQNVEVSIELPENVYVYEVENFSIEAQLDRLLPEPWQEFGLIVPAISGIAQSHLGFGSSTASVSPNNRQSINLHIGEIRHGKVEVIEFEEIVLFADQQPNDNLAANWSLTASNVPGRMKGTIQLRA